MEDLGVKFIRFSEGEMKYDMQNVIRALEGKIIEIVKSGKTIKLPKGFDINQVD